MLLYSSRAVLDGLADISGNLLEIFLTQVLVLVVASSRVAGSTEFCQTEVSVTCQMKMCLNSLCL